MVPMHRAGGVFDEGSSRATINASRLQVTSTSPRVDVVVLIIRVAFRS